LVAWKNTKEIDFIAKKKTKIKAINVCYSKKLPKREKESFLIIFNKKNL